MKTKSRPQYYRIRRVLEMVREGTQSGYLANSSDFKEELGVSRRTVARDLDFLRDEENAPIEYDESRKGYLLTDDSCSLPPVRLSRKEVFSFSIARKLLGAFEGKWSSFSETNGYPLFVSRDSYIRNQCSGTIDGFLYAPNGDYTQTANGDLTGMIVVGGNIHKGGNSTVMMYEYCWPTPPGGGSTPGSGEDIIGVSAWQQ